MVYFSDSYPHVFGIQGGGAVTVAFEFDVTQLDPNRFYPDEDYLVQKHLVVPVDGQTAHQAARKQMSEFRHLWRDSLTELGTCCYRGRIPRTAFTRMTVFDRSQNVHLALFFAGHEVGIEDHAATGKQFRIINKWLFGRCGVKNNPYSSDGVQVVDCFKGKPR